MLPFLTALTLIDMSRGDDLRAAVHAHFARRRHDRTLLDQALLFFLTAADARTPATARDAGRQDRIAAATRQLRVLDDEAQAGDASPLEMATYSAVEILRHKDFESMTAEEMRAFGDPDTLVANVNTPGEYRELEALQGHKL